ncbi:SUMF1/EgtB/PvdO family nonheme iron enzyme [Parasegetibacter sp. NRK P23]|uniref:SUMF1/EgtB/PvdO family nonheme iron enzyme n=1 Tax=Parasegetibacter sp. NRK P23 TaxID=2942999 RepID=UPI0020440294|nr:SUMF1/EgtB/PvdO family nonheme iron enzyme [Parasegetibacter sp. NRK P23]MCM5527707.1 SUMF1/EgtB/PvdO family nonheme iron enzyme [Parasegetibacter sp. NRK P23]
MKYLYLIAAVVFMFPARAQFVNSIGMKMVPVKAGSFLMGSEGTGENYDESQAHRVTLTRPFHMGATEVTNAQYEMFDPSHKQLRGKNGFSSGDQDAVVFVSYQEAQQFCAWLSKNEGKPYRLPTEAEWEYACRAGTTTSFNTGDSFPKAFLKQQQTNRTPVPVSLQVAMFPANAWGLHDMHGNVEEWCSSWYAPYPSSPQTNPAGGRTGLYRVTRGGSHNTRLNYLRSANRMGMLPEDKHWLTGFRVVMGVSGKQSFTTPEATGNEVNQQKFAWKPTANPVFKTPVPYVKNPAENVPFYAHNHCPAITWCENGDLLAIWFSTNEEHGREMVILQSRLKPGKEDWEPATLFCKVPDRNMTGSSLFTDQQGTLYHMNGVEAAGDWQNLAMMFRTSNNNGETWSAPRLVQPEHEPGHQVIAGMFATSSGKLIQVCDAVPGPKGGSVLHESMDGGKSWTLLSDMNEVPPFINGGTGKRIAGIHAGVVELKDGRLLALGRNDDIVNENGLLRMPLSISSDGGRTWRYAPSPFPPVGSGQRLVLKRLNEGPILLLSFSENDGLLPGKKGMYAALSFDDGATWPVVKLLSDGNTRLLEGGAWTKTFTMDENTAEPKGYLAATQTPDNTIHLLSSNLYYRFNLQWLMQHTQVQ